MCRIKLKFGEMKRFFTFAYWVAIETASANHANECQDYFHLKSWLIHIILMHLVEELREAQLFFSPDMKKSVFDTWDIKKILPVPECNGASSIAGWDLSSFLFYLASPVLMHPLLLCYLKIWKNKHTEGNRSFLAWLSVSDTALSPVSG